MKSDDVSGRIYEHYENIAPSINLNEIRRRRQADSRTSGKTPLRLVSLAAVVVLLLGGVLVVANQLTADEEIAEVNVTAGGEGHWPMLYLSNLGLSEMLVISPVSGDVVGSLPLHGELAAPVSGATVAADGRVAISSGPRVTVNDNDDVYEVSLVDANDQGDYVAGGLRVLPIPDLKAAWIVYDGLASGGSLWQWEYETGDLELTAERLPGSLVPVGVSSEGDLMLNEMTGHSPGADQLWIFEAQSADAEPTVLEGEGLAIYGSLALIRRCEESSRCSLLVHDLRGGEVGEVSVGEVEVADIHSVAPEGPGYSVPATASHVASQRVLVGIRSRADPSEGGISTIAAVDMDDLSLTVLSDAPLPVVAAVWSCDGSDVLVHAPDVVYSLSNAISPTALPEETFLYGAGAC